MEHVVGILACVLAHGKGQELLVVGFIELMVLIVILLGNQGKVQSPICMYVYLIARTLGQLTIDAGSGLQTQVPFYLMDELGALVVVGEPVELEDVLVGLLYDGDHDIQHDHDQYDGGAHEQDPIDDFHVVVGVHVIWQSMYVYEKRSN